MSKFLKTLNVAINPQRTFANRRYNWNGEGIQYFGFKYYPRYADFKDPPYEASKLFRVQRTKPLKGVPNYEKKILAELKLDGRLSDIAVIKNIPENNQLLWKVKHLIKIDPITFPDGVPKDSRGSYLKENGQMRVMTVLKPSEERLQLTEAFLKKPERLDGNTLRRNSRKKWEMAWE